MTIRRWQLISAGLIGSATLVMGVGAAQAGPAAQSPVGGPNAHTHHVHTGNGGCVDIDRVRFELGPQGLHQGVNQGEADMWYLRWPGLPRWLVAAAFRRAPLTTPAARGPPTGRRAASCHRHALVPGRGPCLGAGVDSRASAPAAGSWPYRGAQCSSSSTGGALSVLQRTGPLYGRPLHAEYCCSAPAVRRSRAAVTCSRGPAASIRLVVSPASPGRSSEWRPPAAHRSPDPRLRPRTHSTQVRSGPTRSARSATPRLF